MGYWDIDIMLGWARPHSRFPQGSPKKLYLREFGAKKEGKNGYQNYVDQWKYLGLGSLMRGGDFFEIF